MIACFRRRLSKGQHRISLTLIMDQDQPRVGRQRYIRREAFRSNFFGREILPTDVNSTPLFFISAIAFRFGLLVPNLAAIVIRNAESARRSQRHAGQLENIGDSLTTRVRRARPSNTSKPNYFRFSQRFPTSGGAEINNGED